MNVVRAVLLAMFGIASAAAQANELEGSLADKCRGDFYKILPFYSYLIEPGVRYLQEGSQDIHVAKRAAAIALCRKAAAQGSASSAFFAGMLHAPHPWEYEHLAYSEYGHQLWGFFDIEFGSRPDPQYAYEILDAYSRTRKAVLQSMPAGVAGDSETRTWAAAMLGGVAMLPDWPLVARDEDRMLDMLRSSANEGDPRANGILGMMLLHDEKIEVAYHRREFPRHSDSDGNWALDTERFAETIALLRRAADRGDQLALIELLHTVFNYYNLDDGRQLGPRDLAAIERYCEIAVRRAVTLNPGIWCAGGLGLAYADPGGDLGVDYAKSAYWLSLHQHRLILDRADASSRFSKHGDQLTLSLAELDDEQKARVLEVARLGRLAMCDDPYYKDQYSHFPRCRDGISMAEPAKQ